MVMSGFEEKYKQILVGVLKSFETICVNNSLSYFARAGTALGAIRHHGIIPWDDDIDVFMPRKDYQKFLSISQENNGGKYKVAKMGDKDYIYPFAKMYDANTSLVEMKAFPKCCLGVYIDIFPLDEVYGSFDDIKVTKKSYDKLFSDYQATFLRPNLRYVLHRLRHNSIVEVIRMLYYAYCPNRSKEVARTRFKHFDQKWAEQSGDKLLCHHGMYRLDRELMPKKWFEKFEYVPFETTKIRVMQDYDSYLSHLFGDYMTPPPLEQQKSHHFHY